MGMRAKFLGHGRGCGGETLTSQWHHSRRPSTAHTQAHTHTHKWLRVLLGLGRHHGKRAIQTAPKGPVPLRAASVRGQNQWKLGREK